MSHLQQPLFNPNRKYQHLFFDLDHTIWDFEMNSKETLAELYDQNNLVQKGITDFELFFARYNEHNNRLWDRYHKGFIKQDELKWKRMWLTLLDYKIADEPLSRQMGQEFLTILPNKTNLFPYTFEILDYLTERQYDLHLITNGFEATQRKKLANSKLDSYFKEMITSETSNSLKPHKDIFDYAFAKTKALPEKSIMIGDNLEADIQGGINAGIDTMFVNHINVQPHIKATYEVTHLKMLENIF
jgi:putative hydrolase of the HAD superfamily